MTTIPEMKGIADTVRPGYWYLASPYTLYPLGKDRAFSDISRIAWQLIEAGVPVFCPIAHSTPIARHTIPENDTHDVWLPLDLHLMRGSVGIIVAKMDGWDQSYGVQFEIDYFTKIGKPIIYLDVNHDQT